MPEKTDMFTDADQRVAEEIERVLAVGRYLLPVSLLSQWGSGVGDLLRVVAAMVVAGQDPLRDVTGALRRLGANGSKE